MQATQSVIIGIVRRLPETELKTDDQIFASCEICGEVSGAVATVKVPPTLVTVFLKRSQAFVYYYSLFWKVTKILKQMRNFIQF